MQVVSFLDRALVNFKRVDFYLVDLAGTSGVDVMSVDPAALRYVERGLIGLVCLASAKELNVTRMRCYYCSFGGDYFWQTGSCCSGLLAEYG